MDNIFKESSFQSTQEFDIKTEVKSEYEDELANTLGNTENKILSLIKVKPEEADDQKNTALKNNSSILPCNDILKTEVQTNIVKEELVDFSNEEHDSGLMQDSKIEVTEHHLIKNDSGNFNIDEKTKTETVQKDGKKVKELVINIVRLCLEKNENIRSPNSCDYKNRELKHKKMHKTNIKRDLQVLTEDSYFLCQLCNKKFFTKQCLDQHIISVHWENKKMMNIISHKQVYKCSMCKYNTALKAHLIHHMMIHKKSKMKTIYQCDTCDFISIYKCMLKRHLQVHTAERHFRCQTCDKMFKTKRNLDCHILSVHSENKEMMNNITYKINKCTMCDYKTFYHTTFKIHMQRHESVKNRQTFQCDICSYKTIFSDNLRKHIQNHTGERRFSCQTCNKTYFAKQKLDGHILSTHSDNKTLMDSITYRIYKCSMCDYKTVYSRSVKIHIQTHEYVKNGQKHQCNICDFKTMFRGNLKRHIIEKHLNERQFPCQICDKKYLRKRDLDGHILSKHTENKKLLNNITYKINKCTLCEFKTISIYHFEIHVQRHKEIKTESTYQCDICGYKTKSRSNLIRHIKIHRGKRRERSFLCRICDKKYLAKQSLNSHVVLKHSDNKELMNSITSKIYKCDICEYKTVSSYGIKNHLRTHNRG